MHSSLMLMESESCREVGRLEEAASGTGSEEKVVV